MKYSELCLGKYSLQCVVVYINNQWPLLAFKLRKPASQTTPLLVMYLLYTKKLCIIKNQKTTRKVHVV